MNTKTTVRSFLFTPFFAAAALALAASFSAACAAPVEGSVEQADESIESHAQAAPSSSVDSATAPRISGDFANLDTPDNSGAATPQARRGSGGRAQ